MIRISTTVKGGRVHTLMHDREWITIAYTHNQSGETAHVNSVFSPTLQEAGERHLFEAKKLEKSCQNKDISAETPSE